MEPKEERVLQKCSEIIKKDLDPTYSFLYELFSQKVLSHQDVESIMGNQTKQLRVAKLLTILPRRGHNAFAIFKSQLQKNHSWLAVAMEKELVNLTRKKSENKIHTDLVQIINSRLVPLVFSQPFDYAEHNESMQKTVNKIEFLAKKLESNVHAALELSIPPKKNLSIDKLIEEKLKMERSEESTETRKLREKLHHQEDRHRKEMETMKNDLTQLRQTNRKLQRQMQQTTKENKILRAKSSKLAKDVEKFTADNKNLRQAMTSMKSQSLIQELFPPGQ